MNLVIVYSFLITTWRQDWPVVIVRVKEGDDTRTGWKNLDRIRNRTRGVRFALNHLSCPA